MGDDDARSTVGDGVGKDFAGMDGAAVNEADGNNPDVEDFVGTVDCGAKEMLLFAVGVVADEGGEDRRGPGF